MPVQKTAVIGGGMAGCAAARELMLAGHEVTVFEAESAVGGRAHSWHRPEITPDTGVNLWFTNFYRELHARIKEYGLEHELEPMENSVIIVADGKHAELRATSAGTLLRFPFVGLADKLRFLATTVGLTMRRGRLNPFEPAQLAAYDDRDAADWASKAMSPAVYQYLIRPTVESFWLWRCEEISAAHVKAMQANAAGAQFYVLRGGLESVAVRMVEGADVRTGTEVSEVATDGGRVRVSFRSDSATDTETFDQVVVATTASVAAKITASLPTDVVPAPTRQFCESQRYEPVVSISYLLERGAIPSDFHIVPGGPGDRDVRGMIAWPRTEQTPDGPRERDLVFVYLGRQTTAELMGASDEERYARGLELAPQLWPDFPADKAKPFHIVTRQEGLPWPEPGRFRTAARIAATQRGPVVFAGDYLGGPMVEAAMRTGIRAARALTGGKSGSGT